MFKYVFKYLIIFLVISCTSEVELPFPKGQTNIVLNGILNPDSIIKISITKTLPIESTGNDFPIVTDASVLLYENDQLLDKLNYRDSIYSLNYYPKAGREYRIEVQIPGYPMLRASDKVPYRSPASICYKNDTIFNKAIDINIKDPVSEKNYYWLDGVMKNGRFRSCGEGNTCNHKQIYFQSYSNIPDRFNAFVDNTLGGVTQYDFYLRINDDALNGEVIQLDIACHFVIENLQYEQSYLLNIINASQHYDRYLKSSVTYALNQDYNDDEDIGFKPFAESSQIYSNIENGTGIFAAYNSVSIPVEDHPCDE